MVTWFLARRGAVQEDDEAAIRFPSSLAAHILNLGGNMRRFPVFFIVLFLLGFAACSEHRSPLDINHDALRINASLNAGETNYLQEQITQLHASGLLTGGQANSLIAKVAAAAQQLTLGNNTVAEKIMAAWQNELTALVAAGILTGADASWLLRIASGAADISGTYDYAGYYWPGQLGPSGEFQYARGTLTLDWLDRNAGTFIGQLYRESRGTPDTDFIIVRTLEVRNGVFNRDGTVYFDVIFPSGTTEVLQPHTGTFDGVTMAGPAQNSINIRFVATKQ